MAEHIVDARWDGAVGVWVATSDTVPGVAVEAATCEEVIEVLTDALPDLLRANGLEHDQPRVSVVFDRRVEAISLAAT